MRTAIRSGYNPRPACRLAGVSSAVPTQVPSNRRWSMIRLCTLSGAPEYVQQLSDASLDAFSSALRTQESQANGSSLSRRSAVLLALLASTAWLDINRANASEAASLQQQQEEQQQQQMPTLPAETILFYNSKQHYQFRVPAGWDKIDKAGADVLFEDPARRSSSVGVTVNPVRVKRIQDFGSLEVVGKRLLDAERKKESTLGVELLQQSQRECASGAVLYDYEYELDSTRGRKRILNTVTIFNSRLYILNGACKCEKEGCKIEGAAAATVQLLRDAAASFEVAAA